MTDLSHCSRLKSQGVIRRGPEIVTDEAGRRTRNMEIQPCGCWHGDVERDVPLFNPDTGEATRDAAGNFLTAKQWAIDDFGACDIHGAQAAVLSLQASEEIERRAGRKLDLPPQHARFLADAPRILAEAAALDAELAAIGLPARGIPQQLQAAAVMAGQPALMPAAPAPKALSKRRRRR